MRPVAKAYNLNAICEPIVLTMWNFQHLTTLYSSTACYGDSFTLICILSQSLSGCTDVIHVELRTLGFRVRILTLFLMNMESLPSLKQLIAEVP
jgi:hypothetical protein